MSTPVRKWIKMAGLKMDVLAIRRAMLTILSSPDQKTASAGNIIAVSRQATCCRTVLLFAAASAPATCGWHTESPEYQFQRAKAGEG